MKHSGILLHISSLPSPYGIGTLGSCAYEFIDFLSKSHQKYWQILPICPTGYGDSPYQSFSSFAGNPYFIDLDYLAAEGLLRKEEFADIQWSEDESRVDYGRLSEFRIPILKKAAERLIDRHENEFVEFCNSNRFWLDDYSRYMSIKNMHNNRSWLDWEDEYRDSDSESVELFAREHADEILEWKAIQFMFFCQWNNLKSYAEEKGVSIVGDMPMYVSLDSADVWAQPELFQLDENRIPIDVSGCPPDGFSDKGQLWGNPLFDWDYIRRDGYKWWIKRISYLLETYHVLRIDHFRGFDEYFAIPYGAEDAKGGVWRPGPGIELFRAVEKELGKTNIIAEDLGFLTPSVKQLLEDCGFPGMKVLEMAFDQRDSVGSEYLPENYDKNSVAYVGTHDNDTAIGWLESAPEEDVQAAVKYLNLDNPDEYSWQMMRAIWRSEAGITIVQAQDLLCLGSEARMNTPSISEGNWQWRMNKNSLTDEISERLRAEMKAANRLRF